MTKEIRSGLFGRERGEVVKVICPTAQGEIRRKGGGVSFERQAATIHTCSIIVRPERRSLGTLCAKLSSPVFVSGMCAFQEKPETGQRRLYF
jgi:hypothetical protein